jgi:hypothetical protein
MEFCIPSLPYDEFPLQTGQYVLISHGLWTASWTLAGSKKKELAYRIIPQGKILEDLRARTLPPHQQLIQLNHFSFAFFEVLEFKLRVSHLLGRRSTT